MPLASAVPTGFLTPSYSTWAVTASFLVATLASFVAINLARRVRSTRGFASAAWWLAGALVMGTGIWSTHFVGMQAFQLSIPLGYRGGLTLLSWTAAVAASGVALGLASHGGYRRAHLALGALAMGSGIGAMHYLGMAAIDLTVGIVWNGWLVAASLMVAVAASASALFIFQAMHRMPRAQRPRYQAAAALVMGAAICGMHYTGMAAAHFPAGAVCLSAKELGGPGLTALVLMASGMLLVSTLFTAILDARLQQTALQLTRSLQESNAKLQHANAELQQRAYADALTGLPNRLLFEDRLNHALLRLERANHHRVEDRLAVLFIDLDGFKPVNDSFGHAAGDVILVEAADRLRAQARECDTIARVGGDEFLLLLEDISSTADAIAIARRVLETLTCPFSIEGKDVEISCSIGVVVHPDHGERDKLVAHADAAMYAAKRAGGNGYVLFEPHMGSEAADQLGLQSDLRHALERGQLALHYQPKIDSTRGCISGVEALLRWHHPTRGMVSPTVFIALAERFGLINRLGNWVIDEACRQIAEWRASGVRMRVAINLSVHQLRESGLAERIAAALRRHAVEPDQLLCEITESVAMEDIKATQHTFDELARIGVFLSIDDFGTGYSSLNYLRQLPARQLKIDRSFVCDIEHKQDARAVVDAVVRLAHALGLRVVAEGVETVGQHNILMAMGCDELQGFFYAHPLPADTLLEWTRGNAPDGTVTGDFAPSLMGE
ncbi:bifunctional diguanylate cyclase/phosphodiesterase [Acidovorax sp. MR-S7]|uniref:putative bifunctional diguanylate cyclase/phosphodiesterase n=1 Tax=Acidovorax sp. MR-S7 TaxID=1268622 RepID=UPI0003D3EC5D|nr:EAL domain-containing protein [Acidovorax sp. MR-S7]GAD21092.1 predicted signal transduction protein containing a membrane domain, an EAL and a GGDEF domain [Acidovorax sp. MR-S7]